MTEPTLFAPPTDPHVDPVDVARLTGQNRAIIDRLRIGPATNKELAGIALKYTSRVSDLRAAGYDIQARAMRDGTGRVLYTLGGNP